MSRRLGALAAGLLLLTPLGAAAEPLELFGNRLFVQVSVNGRPATALLDSGAEMTVLDDDFAAALGLTGSGGATAHGTGAETMEARFAEGVAVSAVDVDLEQNVAILDLDEVAQRLVGREVSLILGRELFDSARLRIDIAGGTIDRVPAEAAPAGVRLPVGDHRGTPTIPAAVEGHEPVEAVFDLGNGSEVLIGRAYAERLGIAAPDRIVERRRGGGLGGAVERDIVRLRNLVVAGREYRDVPAAIDDGATAADLNIGTSILRDFLITTDFAGRAVWLEPRQ